MSAPLFVRRIWQEDNHSFSIEWGDSAIQTFRLCDLQRSCPCAHCMDEITGNRLADPQQVSDDVRAIAVRSVGRYGLRIQFTAGCSMGIFTFDRLRSCV